MYPSARRWLDRLGIYVVLLIWLVSAVVYLVWFAPLPPGFWHRG